MRSVSVILSSIQILVRIVAENYLEFTELISGSINLQPDVTIPGPVLSDGHETPVLCSTHFLHEFE